MRTDKIINKIHTCNTVNVSKGLDVTPKRDNYVREFNKGKSFSFTPWSPITKYTNDDFKQDFVTYKTSLLACKTSHVSSEPPVIIYDSSGMPVGTSSSEWYFIFASGIAYNNYYFDLENAELGEGLAIKDGTTLYANAEAVTTEDIVCAINLGERLKAGDVIPRGTSVQQLLTEVFTASRISGSNDIPILTAEAIRNMSKEEIPNKYVEIPSEDEMYETYEGSSYIDILFSSIRKLQAEVARLRNSFKYGISSYTNANTAMSEVIDNTVKDEEPLWATDESDLSGIPSAMFNFDIGPFTFKPTDGYKVSPGKLVVTDMYFDDPDEEIKLCADPKLYLYTTSSAPNIKYLLTTDTEETYEIDLKEFVDINVDKYNTLLVISRKVKKTDDTKFVGFNYIWISVGDYNTGQVLVEGYYNPHTGQLGKIKIDCGICTLSRVEFKDLDLYKFDGYSKYQDFGLEVNPSSPTDQSYKYEAAHITIRAVKNYDELETIESKLPNNELIWDESAKKLYIKSKDALVAIGSVGSGGGSSDSGNTGSNNGMTEREIINLLKNMGIVHDSEGGLQLSSVSDVTFINNDTGKQFKYEVNSEGELVGNEVITNTLTNKLNELAKTGRGISTASSFRGFIARLLCADATDSKITATYGKDVGIYADRVAIAGVYCPLSTDTKFGCTHGFIEIANVSQVDIPLDGCYLHYLHPASESGYITEHLPLKGVIKAGSTYLVRCKKYANSETNTDVIIDVNSYDQEWYINGELLDLTIDASKIGDGVSPYAFALTYGNKNVKGDDGSLGATLDLEEFNDAEGEEINENAGLFQTNDKASNSNEAPKWPWYYIDSLVLNAQAKTGIGAIWSDKVQAPSANSLIKRTFALDPAKQAFNGCTTYDSSRYRNANVGTDIQVVDLSTEKIAFPNSDDTYPISRYTPQGSKLKKNVCTDKTKLDMKKPNMVTCSFGINMYTTRCFNWVSAGQFDEYVFIKTENGWKSFESYKKINAASDNSTSYPRRREFGTKATNAVYARLVSTFPGCEINFTSHKCVIDLLNTPLTSGKQEYTYVVGRKNSDGTPDLEHCSEEMKFTLYSTEYTPRIYQTSDQQGFHWVEYQVWAAAAKTLNDYINRECEAEKIIPVLINTGDMTQNGTRVNEWLDYYNAGKCLFNHLEQMNVTGNNDLCGSDPTVLGTGDDIGKSNSFFFHVCYCYEVNEADGFLPVITTDAGIDKYIPSTYYFDSDKYRFLMCNSEITYVNCRDWFNKKGANGDVVNIYTGFTVPAESGAQYYTPGFTTIYTMLYNIMNDAKSKSLETIVACHEMPFTVMTIKSHSIATKAIRENYRSLSEGSTSLVGAHMNQLNSVDLKGSYWFSRLMEQFKVRLCLGGHKHTYAASFPVREYYFWMDNGVEKNSLTNPGEYIMGTTLENDNVDWFRQLVWDDTAGSYLDTDQNGTATKFNLTKLPIICKKDYNIVDHTDTSVIHPRVLDTTTPDYNGIIYFMCQATGYKLTSNKELPAPYQEFSQLIPKTEVKNGSESASNDQKHPMFGVVTLGTSNITIDLVAVRGIFNDKYKFTQTAFGKGKPVLYYATPKTNSQFCTWETTANHIITI